MMTSPERPAAVALAAPGVLDAVQRAAASAGLEVVTVATLSELLGQLRARPWAATVLSLTTEHVDEAVVRTLSERGQGGALILTAPGLSLERAMLAERCGAVALMREPIDDDELARRLMTVRDEGPEVPLPVADSEPSDAGRGAPLLVGESPRMGEVFQTIARVARSAAGTFRDVAPPGCRRRPRAFRTS